MGGRDHSCEGCGRGGFNDPDGVCECVAPDNPSERPECPSCQDYLTCPICGTDLYAALSTELEVALRERDEARAEAGKRVQDAHAAAAERERVCERAVLKAEAEVADLKRRLEEKDE